MGDVVSIATMSGQERSAKEIEAAMVAAIEEAVAEGVSDQDEIRKRALAAREAVKNSGVNR